MPLWLIGTRNTTTFIEKKIAVVKEKSAENGGYICPGPLSVGIVLNTKERCTI
jgi:hypothetical protein